SHMFETVGTIKLFKTSNIIVEQRLAIAAMRKETSCWLNLHAGTERVFRKSFITNHVAADLDFHQLVTRARFNNVRDSQLVAAGIGVLRDSHLGIEVAAALQIVEQIAPALVQQVIVQRILFINWDVPL